MVVGISYSTFATDFSVPNVVNLRSIFQSQNLEFATDFLVGNLIPKNRLQNSQQMTKSDMVHDCPKLVAKSVANFCDRKSRLQIYLQST